MHTVTAYDVITYFLFKEPQPEENTAQEMEIVSQTGEHQK